MEDSVVDTPTGRMNAAPTDPLNQDIFWGVEVYNAIKPLFLGGEELV